MNKFKENFKNNNPNIECPSRLGVKWTEEEEIDLINKLKDNNTIEEISRQHDRTTGGIISRIKIIAYKLIKEGKSIDYIKNITKLSEEEIKTIKTEKELELSQKRKIKETEIKQIKYEINNINKPEISLDDIMDILLKINKNNNIDDKLDNINSELILINQNMKNIYKCLKKLKLA